ncbi:biotin transport system substrate-specific component [Faunimonas pinastri]|uniref:Biotin transporter n=1 Tax=Faunimonas pinastri TaxID=1855383 RepID=A0A1H9JJX4_9HYPH|nr:biotin transporter BioY [Faunimonas pinastri]SEQ87048.1 biotin transport system substrate-specific component [Faunimonas pinastri]
MNAVAYTGALVSRVLPASRNQRLAMSAGFALLGSLVLTIAAKTVVPFVPVPMTLGSLAVVAIAAAYGSRLGVATMLLYLAEGAIGLPVFAGTPEKGLGLMYMAGPTGGYLVGYLLATALVGFLAERGFDRNPLKLFGAMLAGDILIFAFGAIWLGTLLGWDKPIMAFGVTPFLFGDLVKMALAACIFPAVRNLIRR